ncbi:hypothetical protein [Nocardia stercoris]|uniref:Ig-like domain repeat protein n=1 Tax=Nocardia stercoris TaxID=2483361 RepID=A0A3M2KV19_9NOCA|nr:hypothetical protein [Nocardia stercoris]RMI29477.1 hypothetical protein EBN03_25700 [Nocardia stercoris]
MGMSKKGGFGLTAFGAMAAVAVVAAPNANAVVQYVTVTNSTGTPPTAFMVGCTYKVTANVDASNLIAPVTFTDNGVKFNEINSTIGAVSISVNWTPTTAGAHNIVASAWFSSAQQTVTVADRGPLSSLLPASSAIGGCTG